MTRLPVGHVFIAGTDTAVGKTWVAVRLLRAWGADGHRVAGMKPVAAGAMPGGGPCRNDDALALQAAGNVPLPYERLNSYCLPDPTSPHLAARRQGIAVDIGTIVDDFRVIESQADAVIVEGAGGWWAPLGEPPRAGERGPTMADIAQALQLPVLLVVGLRLGCLNHALLSADAIERSGRVMAGWVANPVDPDFRDRADYIESLDRRLPAPRIEVA